MGCVECLEFDRGFYEFMNIIMVFISIFKGFIISILIAALIKVCTIILDYIFKTNFHIIAKQKWDAFDGLFIALITICIILFDIQSGIIIADLDTVEEKFYKDCDEYIEKRGGCGG